MTTTSTHAGPNGLRDLFLLRPGVVFFNHGSFGACPRTVFEAYQGWQLELERQPVEFVQRRSRALLHEAREALGAFVGADAADLVYVTNVTMGLNIVARSLPLDPGDEVLTTDHEYGSLNRTWEFVCEKRGARYVHRGVALPITSAEEVVEAIWSGVTDRTRVLFISHITSPTALIFPIEELVRRARGAGIITVIDGAHAPGQVPLDLEALGADFYSGNCHKWMMAPKGSGFLYARREMQHLLEPLVGGRLSRDPQVSLLVDEHQYQGTRDLAAFLSVPAAIQFMQEHDWPAVQRTCHELVRHARGEISALTGVPPVVPDAPAWYAQMAILPLPPSDLSALKTRLYDEYGVEVPPSGWGGRHFIRLSVQGYNTRSDIDRLVEGLAALLPEVALRGEGTPI
ncbi:MAG: aminotransferase class V-fold PLP-dependent enzyme [Anaerolineae bacterium]|nr:aminotransferase class V-fold PLP-dependent enzyme [Anaerolineae bacterium]